MAGKKTSRRKHDKAMEKQARQYMACMSIYARTGNFLGHHRTAALIWRAELNCCVS
jgi:hypothetical protein